MAEIAVATTVADGQLRDMKAGRRRVTVAAALARARRLVTVVVVADAQPRVTAVADVLLPAPAVAMRRRVVEPRTVVADPHMVAVAAPDMGGNTALDFFPA